MVDGPARSWQVDAVVGRSAFINTPCVTTIMLGLGDVGDKDAKSFAIHSLLVTRQSPVFEAMINGQMKEAVEARVRLNEVDQDTVVRFLEYLYGDDYNSAEALAVLDQDEHTLCDPDSPAPIAEEAAPMDGPPPEPVADHDWALGSKSKHKKHKRHPRHQDRDPPLQAFEDFALPRSEPQCFEGKMDTLSCLVILNLNISVVLSTVVCKFGMPRSLCCIDYAHESCLNRVLLHL